MATAIQLQNTAAGYASSAKYAALFTNAATRTAAGTEVSGAPYQRVLISWSAGTGGVETASVVLQIPSGVLPAGFGIYDALTGGNYLDGGSLSTSGLTAPTNNATYTLSLQYQQTS